MASAGLRVRRWQSTAKAEFIDPIDLVPLLGTASRARRVTQGTVRTYGWLKRRRVGNTKRVVLSGLVGSHQMLRAQRIFPYGAALHILHSGGRAAARATRQGKGLTAAAKAFRSSGRGAISTTQSGLEQAFQPAISYGKSARRTYRMLGDAGTPKKRMLAANAVGTRQAMKDGRGFKKFYGLDRRGRRIVRYLKRKATNLIARRKQT